MDQVRDFHLYIPVARRQSWSEFRDKVENEGKKPCDVLMDLVDEYLGKKES